MMSIHSEVRKRAGWAKLIEATIEWFIRIETSTNSFENIYPYNRDVFFMWRQGMRTPTAFILHMLGSSSAGNNLDTTLKQLNIVWWIARPTAIKWWNSDVIPNPELFSPQNYGWQRDKDELLPVMTKLVKCGWSKERCSTYQLLPVPQAGLHCTDLCSCFDTGECENVQEDEDVLADEGVRHYNQVKIC